MIFEKMHTRPFSRKSAFPCHLSFYNRKEVPYLVYISFFFSVFHYLFLQYYIYIVQFIICWIRKFVSCTGKNPTWRIFQICYDIIKREQVVSDAYYAFSLYRKRWLWFFHLIAKCFKQYSQVGDSEWWPQWQKEVNVCW